MATSYHFGVLSSTSVASIPGCEFSARTCDLKHASINYTHHKNKIAQNYFPYIRPILGDEFPILLQHIVLHILPKAWQIKPSPSDRYLRPVLPCCGSTLGSAASVSGTVLFGFWHLDLLAWDEKTPIYPEQLSNRNLGVVLHSFSTFVYFWSLSKRGSVANSEEVWYLAGDFDIWFGQYSHGSTR
jgi:hypothetical protein